MGRTELRIIPNAPRRQDAGCNLNSGAPQSASQPLVTPAEAGIDSRLCPTELPFLEEQRAEVTILFGGSRGSTSGLLRDFLPAAAIAARPFPKPTARRTNLARNSVPAACAIRSTSRRAISSDFCVSLRRADSALPKS